MTGEDLSDLVFRQDPGVQFNWCVLSGVPNGTSVKIKELGTVPSARGNPKFWVNPPSIQLPQAKVELVSIDSGTTLLISRDDDLTRRFRTHFREARDLAEFNRALAPRNS